MPALGPGTDSTEERLKQQDGKVETSGAVMEALGNSEEMEAIQEGAQQKPTTIPPPSAPHPTPMPHTSRSFL